MRVSEWVRSCEEELRRLRARWGGPQGKPGPGDYLAERAHDFAKKKHAYEVGAVHVELV